jgi:transcriptional regulator GlxA family with amidase domain
MLNVTVVLLGEGFASTAIAPLEIFYAAGALWRQLRGEAPDAFFNVTTASIDGASVNVPYGLGLSPQKSIVEIERTDVIIIPTSGLALDLRLVENSALLPWLRYHYARGAYIAGVCMGSAYLAEAGLLDGKQATTHWALGADFTKRYPKVKWRPDLLITEDSRLLCSGGISASMDVSLYLVEKLAGHEIAVQTAKALLLNMPRAHQSGYAVLPFSPDHSDDSIRVIELYLQSHYCEALSADELADRCGMSPRTFLRRFKAATGRLPGAYLQTVRIEVAKAMLERERTSVQAIAGAVGYEDVSFFRALFKRITSMNPADYRARFGSLAVRQADNVAAPDEAATDSPPSRPALPAAPRPRT